jgi:hypothetical protein
VAEAIGVKSRDTSYPLSPGAEASRVIVVYNGLAFLCIGSGMAVFWTLCWLAGRFELDSKIIEPIGILLGMVAAFALDLLYRWGLHRDEGAERYFSPSRGGMFMFLPIWLLAMVALLIVGGVMGFRAFK